MTQQFKDVSWNTSDLIGCKQALEILYNQGVEVNILLQLNFGSLDVQSVLDDLGAL